MGRIRSAIAARREMFGFAAWAARLPVLGLAIFFVVESSLFPVTARAQTPAPLTFGVLNQQSPALTAKRWNPILAYVGSKAGVKLELRMGATVAETNAIMGKGGFDFVYTNHYFQTEYARVPYSVIARWRGEPIRGVIAVRDASPAKHLSDLNGLLVAFPTPDAFVAYAAPMAALNRAKTRVREIFAGNQDGAIAQLAAERVDAAAVNSRFLSEFAKRRPFEVRVIYESEAYPELPVLAHGRVSPETVVAVRAALLGMHLDAAAAAILEQSQSRGFEAATGAEYERVRQVYRAIGQ